MSTVYLSKQLDLLQKGLKKKIERERRRSGDEAIENPRTAFTSFFEFGFVQFSVQEPNILSIIDSPFLIRSPCSLRLWSKLVMIPNKKAETNDDCSFNTRSFICYVCMYVYIYDLLSITLLWMRKKGEARNMGSIA